MKWFLRLLIIAVIAYAAHTYAVLHTSYVLWTIAAPIIAVGLILGVYLKEASGFKLHPMAYVGGFIGAIFGLFIGSLLGYVYLGFPDGTYLFILINTFFGYLGYSVGIAKGEELGNLIIFKQSPSGEPCKRKLLDTSVIIDGRIPDICEAGFIDGVLLVPHFILNELQHIADSSDSLKRTRGRRGLDILNRLQKSPNVTVELTEKDFPKIKEVDTKLIALAKELDADILTNDFNLNKVARIQGINVLNINQLANAVKPIVLPGESISVTITKQGKEKDQGVAYLDDGTMVVVENGEQLLNRGIDVVVTSILQTPAGRMIFASPKNNGA